MPDQRSVMKEYRYLEEKRVTEGLTPEEDARYAKLRDLVGPEMGAGGVAPRPGFNVNAAAAKLRESLLPAGLRNRPPPTPAEPVPEPAETPDADAFASEWSEDPDQPAQPHVQATGAEVDAEAFDPDAAFDPATLNLDAQALDPNAAYDAGAQPGWDPNQSWDPNAYPADAAAQPPYEPGAAAYDPNATHDPNAAYDPNALGGWDPNQPWDAAGAVPGTETYDPNAGYDPGAQEYVPGPQVDPGAPELETGAAPDAAGEADIVPAEPLDPGFDASAEPRAEPAPLDTESALPPEAWEVAPAPPESANGAPLGEYDADGTAFSHVETGETGVPGGLPFDGPDASSVTAGDAGGVPENQAAPLGEDDETQGFWGEPYAAADLSAQGPSIDGELAPGEGREWHPEAAVEEGFQLASEGSFGAGGEAPATPWEGTPPPDAPAEPSWEGAPPPDAPAEPSWEGAPPPDAPAEPSWEGAPPPDAPAEPSWEGAPPPDAPAEPPWEGAPPSDAPAEPPWEGAPPPDAPTEPPWEGAPPPDAPAEPPWEGAPPSDAPAEPPWEGAPPPDAPAEPSWEGAPPPDAPAEPPWEGAPPPDAPAEPPWEGAPPPDAAAVPEAPAGGPSPDPDPLDLAVDVMAADPAFARAAGADAGEVGPAAASAFDLDVEASEEIPTVDGADILEEIPEESAAPPPRSLDFEPLVQPEAPAVPSPEPAEMGAAAPDERSQQPPPASAAVPSPPQEIASPSFVVTGAHRVVVHTVEGQVKRGALQDPDLGAQSIALAVQPGATAEAVPTDKVKAIFFMLAPGEKPPSPEGKKVRVTFCDGRQVAGFSPGYDEAGLGFFMIPGDSRTSTGRIWVYRSAVRQVVVS